MLLAHHGRHRWVIFPSAAVAVERNWEDHRVDDATLRWCLVLPVKRLVSAKTRLDAPYDLHRRDLALAFARDTVAAAVESPPVFAVLVVTDDPEVSRALRAVGAAVVPDEPRAGLNAAFLHGASEAARRVPGAAVGALAGDLPALRTSDLTTALEMGARHPRSYVADAEGTGTTLLMSQAVDELAPSFGPGSAARHQASGAFPITPNLEWTSGSPGLSGVSPRSGSLASPESLASLRRDVDAADQLEEALALGVGAWTIRALQSLRAG